MFKKGQNHQNKLENNEEIANQDNQSLLLNFLEEDLKQCIDSQTDQEEMILFKQLSNIS